MLLGPMCLVQDHGKYVQQAPVCVADHDRTGQVKSILASPGENPELHEIPEFTGRAVEAFQSSEA